MTTLTEPLLFSCSLCRRRLPATAFASVEDTVCLACRARIAQRKRQWRDPDERNTPVFGTSRRKRIAAIVQPNEED